MWGRYRTALGWTLIAFGALGSCNVALLHGSRINEARCKRRAEEFMRHLQREDYAWFAKEVGRRDFTTELRKLRQEYGALQSWTIDEWYGYPFASSGGVEVTETRRGVPRCFVIGMVTTEKPILTMYDEDPHRTQRLRTTASKR